VFDGVHLGHQAAIRQLAAAARTAHATAVATTFEPLPIQVLAPGAPPAKLSDLGERIELLRRAGAEAVVVFGFDRRFAEIGADAFLDSVLGAGDVRRVVVGPDFHFGHRAQGDVEKLRERAARAGFDVEVMTPFRGAGEVVSSTRIRNLLLSGDVTAAEALLGRPYAVAGRVLRGATHGRALGYPTIALSLPRDRILPRDGIYAVRLELGDHRLAAAASLGVRPAVAGGDRILEAYLLDFAAQSEADGAVVAFAKRLRDEIAFASPAELSAQIARDVEETRRALS
jgi:riboflavin kinase/FMN adenylyltransferase